MLQYYREVARLPGETTQRIADGLFREISEYQYGIQFTSIYMPGDFVPHISFMDEGYSTASLAETFGLPYVIRRKTRPYDTTTLDYNWQVWNTQAFSLYTTSTSNTYASTAVIRLLADGIREEYHQQMTLMVFFMYCVKTQNLSLKFAVVNVYNTGE